ncbi:hypothetical protein D3C87_242050 [compost metagenome]
MRWIVLLLLITASVNTWANGKAYLNMEDGQPVSVFNKPGVLHWKVCKETPGCEAVAWPDRDSEITILEGPVTRKVQDFHTEKTNDEQFYKVRVEYMREVSGEMRLIEKTGWIDAAYVSRKKEKTFFGSVSKPKATDTCETPPKKNGDKDPKRVQDVVAPLKETVENNAIVTAADKVKGAVGACVIKPKSDPSKYPDGNPFDKMVMPHLDKQKVPKVLNEKGQPMTQQDLVAIDALSRTLYAEMASCYKHGLQYPMAVAKIAANRSNADPSIRNIFIRGDHRADKSDLAKVVTSRTQFSLWLKKVNGQPSHAINLALCPPADAGKTFWTGGTPGADEVNIWNNTVRIATMAVLFPNTFEKRNPEMPYFYYTSGMGKFYGMKQVNPSADGRRISRNSCMEVWHDSNLGRKVAAAKAKAVPPKAAKPASGKSQGKAPAPKGHK